MKLPPPELLVIDWPKGAMDAWPILTERVKTLAGKAGQNDAYYGTVEQLKRLSRVMDGRALAALMRKRVAARAMTQLWLEDAQFRESMFSRQILEALVQQQQGRLGMLPLQTLIALYFRLFDELDQHEDGLREALELLLKQQLAVRFTTRRAPAPGQRDLLFILYTEGNWLLSIDGPKKLVNQVMQEGWELGEAFLHYELRGLDDGRYARICRAHYYLDTLKDIPQGQYHPVFAELLKESVSKAPYLDGKRIGHKALEILIDRVGSEPGDAWESFIMDLAGDPRIASTARNFIEWWKPLGEARIERVRAWLYKADLRLFLSALEQYGRESGDEALQRMFPARKRFIEGLEKLKLVRRTRLMLGSTAEQAVKRILGNEVKTSFIRLAGAMHDKAVVYIDCGDFCLVEGSHNFKLWVYLQPPWDKLYSYDTRELSHAELTQQAPAAYLNRYGYDAPYRDITHHANTWHNRFFEFLAENGVHIEIESLMFKEDYRNYLQRFGVPYVNPIKTQLVQRR